MTEQLLHGADVTSIFEQVRGERMPKRMTTRRWTKPANPYSALKPVTFHYKSDKNCSPRFGLIAEEVAEVNPELVALDKEGKPYSVRYDQVNAMLLNEFLKEHRKVQEQEAMIAQLKKEFQATTSHQQEQIEALTAGLQKVSAQLEAGEPAPQVVNNP